MGGADGKAHQHRNKGRSGRSTTGWFACMDGWTDVSVGQQAVLHCWGGWLDCWWGECGWDRSDSCITEEADQIDKRHNAHPPTVQRSCRNASLMVTTKMMRVYVTAPASQNVDSSWPVSCICCFGGGCLFLGGGTFVSSHTPQ